MIVKSSNIRLLQADQVLPRDKLSSVGMAGELQIEAATCVEDGYGLMSEEDADISIGCTADGAIGIGGVVGNHSAGAAVGDPRKHEPSLPPANESVLVEQHLHPQAADFGEPFLYT